MTENGRGGTPLVRFSGAACGYRGNPVVRSIDLEIYPGDFLALLGANGSGKSTFLKTVAGIQPPVAGDLQLMADGGIPAPVGYLPQTEKLDPIFPATVMEVVLTGAGAFLGPGRPIRGEHRHAAGKILHSLELAPLAKRRFHDLSAGQKQRVLLARALMAEPRLLLLDEPTSGADGSAERLFQEALIRINREGTAILMITHNLNLARQVAPRALFFHEGRVEVGPTELILEKMGQQSGLAAGERQSS